MPGVSETDEGVAVSAVTTTSRADTRSVDAFFDKVTVNADNPKLRENRLKLLSEIRDVMHSVADFSRVEG